MSPIVIPRRPLVTSEAFSARLSATRVLEGIARGLQAGGAPTVDPCALPHLEQEENVREVLDSLNFDTRMRAARAVILATRELHESNLAGSFAFEIATRARQSGVPAFAITAVNQLDSFDARILDLQVILQAREPRGLEAAGRELARILKPAQT